MSAPPARTAREPPYPRDDYALLDTKLGQRHSEQRSHRCSKSRDNEPRVDPIPQKPRRLRGCLSLPELLRQQGAQLPKGAPLSRCIESGSLCRLQRAEIGSQVLPPQPPFH